jgi:23S rRNA (cytosine1962-C5)-methyltransferase
MDARRAGIFGSPTIEGAEPVSGTTWTRIAVHASAAEPVRRGHPWVFQDAVPRVPVGEPVVLEARGAVVGWGLGDDGDIAVRVLGTEVPDRPDLAAILRDRIGRCDRLRTRMVDAPTDACRIVNGEGDGLGGLVVDRYGELAVVRLYARAWERWLDAIVAGVAALPWVTTIVRRYGVARVDGREGIEVLHGPAPAEVVVVQEGPMRLLVRPAHGQKTGMFLDQREHRALVGRWSAGRTVANLFAYHGGFSVAAALGGAARVTTVDLAPEAIADARENFVLNGLDPDQHAFVVADAFAWLPKGGVDLLIVDPPSLAHGARSVGAARSAYRKLHRHLADSVVRDGLLATSSCTSFLDEPTWRAAVEEGLQGGAWSWLHTSAAPPDHPVAAGHPEGRYLKFGLLRRR